MFCRMRVAHPPTPQEVDAVKMQSCPAYEALHDNIKMQSCPAYEHIQGRGNTIKDVAVADSSQVDNTAVPIYLTVY